MGLRRAGVGPDRRQQSLADHGFASNRHQLICLSSDLRCSRSKTSLAPARVLQRLIQGFALAADPRRSI
jgi:hypothetical protein